MDESLNDLLPLLPPLEEMQKHFQEIQEHSKNIQERFEEMGKRSERLINLAFKLDISDAKIQEIARSVFNGTYQACKCDCNCRCK